MKRRQTCAPDRNQTPGKVPESQPNGLPQPYPRRQYDSEVWNETEFVR